MKNLVAYLVLYMFFLTDKYEKIKDPNEQDYVNAK